MSRPLTRDRVLAMYPQLIDDIPAIEAEAQSRVAEAPIRAAISNAYYEARNNGESMEMAADMASAAVFALLAAPATEAVPLVRAEVRTHDPSKYTLHNSEDGTVWQMRPDGSWKAAPQATE